MKKSHILGIVVIAICIGIIASTAGDASSYVSFKEAKVMATSDTGSKIHVVGILKKDKQGQIIGIEESPDKLSFRFRMVDENGQEQIVLHANPIPQDFDKSEQVVVVGGYNGEAFIADKILLKCPSKYQEEELRI